MDKIILLRNPENGKYFTDYWEKPWSSEIEKAKQFPASSNMDKEIDDLYQSSDDMLHRVSHVEVCTMYLKNN